MAKKILVVGLGNPSAEYEKTPHNAGFWTAQEFLEENGGVWEHSRKIEGKTSKLLFPDAELFFLLPFTFMNKSGTAVQKALHFWKIEKENLIVLHDDSDIGLGRIKIVFGQNSGGHKGVENIIKTIGTNKFTRVKMGIRPERLQKSGQKPRIKAEKFVLKPFSDKEIQKLAKAGSEALQFVLEEGREKAMSRFNDPNCQF